MRKTSLAVIILGLAGVVSLTAAETPVLSRWTDSPARIDGIPDEWLEDAFSREKSVGVEYAFRNDGRNLYILFVFRDPKFLSSIEATGMTLYLSAEGKKQKDYGVRFRKRAVSGADLIVTMEKQGTPLPPEKKQEMEAAKMYTLYAAEAVDKKGAAIAAPASADPPAFHIVKQETGVVYEFRIPLASREIHPAGAGSRPGGEVMVGFEWGGLTEEMRKRMSRLRGGGTDADATYIPMEQSYAGGDENEGMRDRGESSPFAGRQRGPKKHSFWVDVKLAQEQEK